MRCNIFIFKVVTYAVKSSSLCGTITGYFGHFALLN